MKQFFVALVAICGLAAPVARAAESPEVSNEQLIPADQILQRVQQPMEIDSWGPGQDPILPRYPAPLYECSAQDVYGRIYLDRGRISPRILQDNALHNCEAQSGQACVALGCRHL